MSNLPKPSMNGAIPLPVQALVDAFSMLPGIGPKTASRLTYYLLRAPEEQALQLASALQNMVEQTIFCSRCGNITLEDPCTICCDPLRDDTLLAVVEEPLDVVALERTGAFCGKYHVLNGAISPLNGVGPEDLRIAELLARLQAGKISELILATNPGMEGDATALYLRNLLKERDVRVTSLARGLPTGGDIEYVDALTLTRALHGRQEN